MVVTTFVLGWFAVNRPRRRPRPRKPPPPSTPEVPSIGALGYFGTADLTRPQSRGRGRRRGRWAQPAPTPIRFLHHRLLAIGYCPCPQRDLPLQRRLTVRYT